MFLLWVPFWACFGVTGGSKKGFLLFFLGGFFLGGRVLVVGPFLGLFLGSRGALRKDFFCFFFGAFFLGGVFLLWVPFWACFWGHGGL